MATLQRTGQRYPARIRKGEITREGPWTIVQSRPADGAMAPGDLVFVNADEEWEKADSTADITSSIAIVTYEQAGKISGSTGNTSYVAGDFVPAVMLGFIGLEAGAAYNIGTKLTLNTTNEDFRALAAADNSYGAPEAALINARHKIIAMSVRAAADGDIIEAYIQPN